VLWLATIQNYFNGTTKILPMASPSPHIPFELLQHSLPAYDLTLPSSRVAILFIQMLITFPSKKRFRLVVVHFLPCLPAFVGLLHYHANSAGKTWRYWLSEVVK
jgi:hypothetical protein